MSSPISYDLQGQGGGTYINSSSGVVTGNFRWVQVITDAVFTDLLSGNIDAIGDIAGSTVPAGIGIGGRFSTITLVSGSVIAYYA
jgi:hypothetical protein